jgi:hypothetical protein
MKVNFQRLSLCPLDYGAKLIINVTNNNTQEAVKKHNLRRPQRSGENH